MTVLIFKSKALEMKWKLSVYGWEVVDDGSSNVGRTGGDLYMAWMGNPTSKYL